MARGKRGLEIMRTRTNSGDMVYYVDKFVLFGFLARLFVPIFSMENGVMGDHRFQKCSWLMLHACMHAAERMSHFSYPSVSVLRCALLCDLVPIRNPFSRAVYADGRVRGPSRHMVSEQSDTPEPSGYVGVGWISSSAFEL